MPLLKKRVWWGHRKGNCSPAQGGERQKGKSESGDSEEVSESADESDDEDELTGVGSEAVQDLPAQAKRPRKPRKPNRLSNDTYLCHQKSR